MLPDEVQWGAIGGVIVAFIAGIFTWFTQRSRGRVEESIAAVAEWQKLTSTLTADNAALREELTAHDKAHVEEIADIRRRHDAEMKAKDAVIEGLLRNVIQSSKSKAQLMGNLDNGSNGK